MGQQRKKKRPGALWREYRTGLVEADRPEGDLPPRFVEPMRELRRYVVAGAGRKRHAVLCLGVTGGELCVSDALPGSDFCRWHGGRSRN